VLSLIEPDFFSFSLRFFFLVFSVAAFGIRSRCLGFPFFPTPSSFFWDCCVLYNRRGLIQPLYASLFFPFFFFVLFYFPFGRLASRAQFLPSPSFPPEIPRRNASFLRRAIGMNGYTTTPCPRTPFPILPPQNP